MPAILDNLFHKVVNITSSPIGVEGGGGGEPWSGETFRLKKINLAKWLQFRQFSAPHVTKCDYINAQSHHAASLVVIPCRLSAWPGKLGHLMTIWAPIDARQAHEWGLSKSRLLKLWHLYKHELLVYFCICQMAVKSKTWNCVCTRPFLANPVTFYEA